MDQWERGTCFFVGGSCVGCLGCFQFVLILFFFCQEGDGHQTT